MDKISFYNIEVAYGNYILLYNTLTDSLVCFTKEEFSVIGQLLQDLQMFNGEYPLLFEELKKSGFIENENYDELEYIKLQNKRCIFANSDFHITINPTLDCNLSCWYCSVELAKVKHNGGMTTDVVNKVIAHIHHVIIEQKATSLHLDWFGGEPLMYFNKVIEPISAYANKLVTENNVKFSQNITTNATLLNADRIWRMKELNFTRFQIPIDGNEQRHNKIKYFSNNKGTYRLVMDNINMVADIIPNVNIILRINYDRQTLNHIRDIVQDIMEKSKCHIQVDFQEVWQVSCSEKELKLLEEVKEEFRLNGLISDFWAYRPQKFYRCYADKLHQYAINYNGKVFKCTARDYGDDKVIGTLSSNGKIVWNDGLISLFFSKSTFDNERCLHCKQLPICMGPCIQKNYESRINNTPLPCVADNSQFSLTSYVVEDAKKRGLIN